MLEYCYPLKEGEILNESHSKWPLFELVIYGSKNETLKISKRIVCTIKHFPVRVKISYSHDTLKAVEKGAGSDPSVFLNDKLLFEGLIQAEEIENIFRASLKTLYGS